MKPEAVEKLIEFIKALADGSGRIITSYYADDTLGVELKDDSSPVTKADREAEVLMRKMIRKAYPDHGVIGEEYGSENESAEYVWVLDPIGGDTDSEFMKSSFLAERFMGTAFVQTRETENEIR